MPQLSRVKVAGYLTFLILIWGINWPLSKFALAYAPPILFAGLRTFVAGIILLAFALTRYKQLRFKETWPIYVLASVLNIVLYYGFQTVGLQYMPAGLFSAIVFFQPVLLGIFSWLWFGEMMYGLKMVGLLLGFAGVSVMSIGGFSGNISGWGIILAIASALSWAMGSLYMKKQAAQVDSVWMTTMQMLIGGIVMLASGSFMESWADIVWSSSFIGVTLFISVFVIALGWLVYFTLIGTGEASKVGSFTFLIPVVSILISVMFFHEKVTASLLTGLVLIAFSILFVNVKPKRYRLQA
ncbi:DMT family transporter [Paenibacillus sp. ACRRX]|uniref:DMT family transporter n=1 Tax=Paenibacillus sp. ACRRX TaxID=2918206 RepID=UPI001EF5BBDF|nr:DMT family transporter [Paenibacillus sp. ACRRX]MCG7409641.1 DMT family transporter [Paenibacillus sp. ACRRX]